MHSDVTEGGLVFDEALNLSKSGWFRTVSYAISNVLDSSGITSLRLKCIPARIWRYLPIATLFFIRIASIIRSDMVENRRSMVCLIPCA